MDFWERSYLVLRLQNFLYSSRIPLLNLQHLQPSVTQDKRKDFYYMPAHFIFSSVFSNLVNMHFVFRTSLKKMLVIIRISEVLPEDSWRVKLEQI